MEGLLQFGRSIREFQNTSNQGVFMDAETYPIFFERHLVHPARRLKVFINDPNANIRAFYFQYLILCFQVQNKNYDFYMEKLHNFILDPNFSFIFLESDDEKIFNDQQFKRFFLEFLTILESGEFLTVEQALNKYPIADVVFVYFFRSLLIYAQLTNDFEEVIEKNKLFGFLLQNFSVDAAVYEEKCLKFFEAQVFVYQESPYQIYMAYMEIDNEIESNSEKLEEPNQLQNLKRNSDLISQGQQSKKSSSVNQKVSVLEDYAQDSQNQNFTSFRKEKSKQIEQNSFRNSQQKEFQFEKLGFNPQQEIQFEYEMEKRSPSSPNFKENQHFEETTYRTSRATTVQNRDQYLHDKIPPITQIPKVTPLTKSKSKETEIGIEKNNTGTMGFGNVGIRSTEAKNFHNVGFGNVGDSGIGNIINTGISTGFNMGINNQANTRAVNISGSSKMESTFQKNNILENEGGYKKFDYQNSISRSQKVEEPLMYEPLMNKGQGRAIRQDSQDNRYKESIMKKLNISKQFTDSLTLMKISEPYRSNIKKMKCRSREYRESLIRAIK